MSNRAEGFAAIPNWMMREKSISRRAVIVYASLASRSGLGGIHPSQTTLVDETGLSERTVRRSLAELEELGVIERVRRYAKSRGQSNRLPDGYVLHPNGKLPATEAGSSEEEQKLPAKKGEATGQELQVVPLIEVEPVEVEPVNAHEGHTFEDFWVIWPKKNAKKDAERAWAKAVKKVSADVIIDAARAYSESPYRPEKQFIPYGASWLNGERWTDPAPERASGKPMPVDRLRAGMDMGRRLQAQVDAQQRGIAS